MEKITYFCMHSFREQNQKFGIILEEMSIYMLNVSYAISHTNIVIIRQMSFNISIQNTKKRQRLLLDQIQKLTPTKSPEHVAEPLPLKMLKSIQKTQHKPRKTKNSLYLLPKTISLST